MDFVVPRTQDVFMRYFKKGLDEEEQCRIGDIYLFLAPENNGIGQYDASLAMTFALSAIRMDKGLCCFEKYGFKSNGCI